MTLTRTDKAAMRRAILTIRQRDEASREQIDAMLKTDTFEEVGAFASFSAQSRALRLQPWETSLLYVGNLDAALRLPFGGLSKDREAAELLQRMIANGISKYEPDPLAALAAAERATATAK